jgi:hypothetical protein
MENTINIISLLILFLILGLLSHTKRVRDIMLIIKKRDDRRNISITKLNFVSIRKIIFRKNICIGGIIIVTKIINIA